jgi:hypothetical protein
MIGNVWEYTDEQATPSPSTAKAFATLLQPPPGPNEPWLAVRGGSFAEPLQADVIWDHNTVPARWKDPTLGFRCVKDVRSQ